MDQYVPTRTHVPLFKTEHQEMAVYLTSSSLGKCCFARNLLRCAGTDGSRWEQDWDYIWDGQTTSHQLCAQRRMMANLISEQSPSDYHLFQRLQKFLTKQHFPNDDDIQTRGCHRLGQLSSSKSLRFTENGLTYNTGFNTGG
ncbi:hypothetical protein AVEN_26459-1 [Araneus ventricosus]|uniref:Uncharacterized protein n=1 Tax=Araneus ventricosus TaxID=182803 RepID=A0A4Y2XCD4_ARAVE|nr:hypothetical protein AVEN_26459-1 [Araneus ventricosus]